MIKINKSQLVTCNIAKKGASGMQSSSPASAFLTCDMDAARNPFQAILLAVGGNIRTTPNRKMITK